MKALAKPALKKANGGGGGGGGRGLDKIIRERDARRHKESRIKWSHLRADCATFRRTCVFILHNTKYSPLLIHMSAIMNSFAVLFTNKVLCGDHPFVCGLINTYEDSKNLYILMNLENGKELFHVLYRNGPDIGDGHGTAALGKEYAQFVVANLVLGIGHVHAHDFVFRDLKPEWEGKSQWLRQTH